MPNQDRDTSWSWGGGWRRRRRLRRIEPSPEFARFLVGELDSEEYARSLTRPRRADWAVVDQAPPGPIAKATDAAVASTSRVRPTATSRVARVSPEYRRFLREEISSSEYAAALADCARLEGSYRAPAARRFPFSRRNLWGALLDTLRMVFAVGGMATVFLGLFLLCAGWGVKLAASIVGWAWTLSLVGVVLLAFTLRNEVLLVFLRAVRLFHRGLTH